MVLNKKGQMVFYGLMLCITIIVLALALAPATKNFTDSARNETTNLGGQGLNCTQSNLTWSYQGACVITDLTLPYWIIGMIGIGITILGIKIVWG